MKSPEISDFQVTLTEHLYMYQIYHNFRKDKNFYKAGFSRVIVYNSFVFSIFMFCEDRGLKKLLGSRKIKKKMAMDFVWGNLCARKENRILKIINLFLGMCCFNQSAKDEK